MLPPPAADVGREVRNDVLATPTAGACSAADNPADDRLVPAADVDGEAGFDAFLLLLLRPAALLLLPLPLLGLDRVALVGRDDMLANECSLQVAAQWECKQRWDGPVVKGCKLLGQTLENPTKKNASAKRRAQEQEKQGDKRQ